MLRQNRCKKYLIINDLYFLPKQNSLFCCM
uniref:Uncharacterized protein n=1 Tax=Siphoviridae sp. ctCS019 TaxID=2825378 RepID=A0A8S5U5B6_9CAUD|nr:MAG TPA: hypothetical protein [Siphoviridae sp. ctCS019]